MSVKTKMEISKSTLQNIKSVGKKCETYDSILNQRIVCNASGCDRLGKIGIKVPAGRFGEVTLFVCSKCVGKFQDE